MYPTTIALYGCKAIERTSHPAQVVAVSISSHIILAKFLFARAAACEKLMTAARERYKVANSFILLRRKIEDEATVKCGQKRIIVVETNVVHIYLQLSERSGYYA